MLVIAITSYRDTVISPSSSLDNSHGVKPGERPGDRPSAGADDGDWDGQRKEPGPGIVQVEAQTYRRVDVGLKVQHTGCTNRGARHPGSAHDDRAFTHGASDEPSTAVPCRVQDAEFLAPLSEADVLQHGECGRGRGSEDSLGHSNE